MKKQIGEKLTQEDVDIEAAKQAFKNINAARQAEQRAANPQQLAENKQRDKETGAMAEFTQMLGRERHCRGAKPSRDQLKAYQRANEEAKAYAAQIGTDAIEVSEPHKGD